MCVLLITLGTLGGVMAGQRQGTAVGRVACHAKWSSVGRARYLVSLPVLLRVPCGLDSNSILNHQYHLSRTRTLNLDREHAQPPRFNA